MKWVFLILAVPPGLVIGALLLNRAPMFEPPGVWQRLVLYLTTNVAETRTNHPRVELRPLRLAMELTQAKKSVASAMADLGWEDIRVTPDGVSAEVVSTLFGFVDDVVVHLEQSAGEVLVQVRSTSRVGRGDFAANTRHVLQLYQRLRESGTAGAVTPSVLSRN